MARIRGSVVLITGASSGIGAATALAFAKSGAKLALCARRLDRLQAVADRCRAAGSPLVTVRRADISKRVEARAFVAAALRDFERIDILVNNAGVGWRGPLHQMPEEDAQRLVATNLMGPLWAIQPALTAMLEANRGHIINVSSVVGFRAMPYSAVYSATKHAVTGLSHALRGELSGSGVKVTAVYPGGTATEFFTAGGQPGSSPGPKQPAAVVARAIVNAARWPRRDVIIFPYRIGHLVEPLLGGPLDHALGEIRRRDRPEYERHLSQEIPGSSGSDGGEGDADGDSGRSTEI